MFKYYYDEATGLTVIAVCNIKGCKNRRDIVKRLIDTCDMYKWLSFPNALDAFRYAERNDYIKYVNDYIIIYDDFN